MARVVLSDLTKIYPEKSGPGVTAVRRINLEIADREFMVLVGPSGCGKSTTLRMIAGLEDITGGTISIDDRVVNDVAPKDRDIAMVFQNYALYPHMTVYENLAFGLKLRKVPRAEIDRRVRDAATLLGIDALLERKPKALSGGQRQRVAVGRAIVRKPKVFLFDEPLSNLDAKMRASTRAEIARLHKSLNATIIYVTHDQVEAMTLGDRICVMKDGDIMQVADPSTLYNRPANMFVAGFIGSPPMNFFHGTLAPMPDGTAGFLPTNRPADSTTPDRAWQLNTAGRAKLDAKLLLGRPLTLGVRPEDIMLETIPGVKPQFTFSGRIEMIEYLGAETCLHLSTGGTSFIVRTQGQSAKQFAAGKTIPLTASLEKIHFFDPDMQEKRICGLAMSGS